MLATVQAEPISQTREPISGMVTGGVRAHLDSSGHLELLPEPSIRLEDGRVLQRYPDGTWGIVKRDTAAAPIKQMSVSYFIIYGPTMLGERVEVTGGRFFAVDREIGLLRAPEGVVRVYFDVVDRDVLFDLVTHCSGLGTEDSECTRNVEGTVARDSSGEICLTQPVLVPQGAHTPP